MEFPHNIFLISSYTFQKFWVGSSCVIKVTFFLMSNCNKKSAEAVKEGTISSDLTGGREELHPFFENLEILSNSLENQDLELLSNTVINMITLLDDLDYSIPKPIAEFPIFAQLFSIIQVIDDVCLQIKILEFLSNLYDNTDDSSIDCSFIFSEYSSIDELILQLIEPIIIHNDSLFGMFLNFLRSITTNIDRDFLIQLTKYILLPLYAHSKFLLSNSQISYSSLPQAIDYFAAFIHSIYYIKLFTINHEEEEASDECKEIQNLLARIVHLYFQKITSFLNPAQILHILYFFIDENDPNHVPIFLNKDNEQLIYKFLDITRDSPHDESKNTEQVPIATALLELLNLSLEKVNNNFFFLINYPYQIIYNDIEFILENNLNSSNYIKFLDICFDFLTNSIAYNNETVQNFMTSGFLSFLAPISENYPFKIRKGSTEFFYNMLFSMKQWGERQSFIESDFFSKSLLDITKHSTPIIQRLLSLMIVCLENKERPDIRPSADTITQLFQEEPDLTTSIEELAINKNESIALKATTILELIESN